MPWHRRPRAPSTAPALPSPGNERHTRARLRGCVHGRVQWPKPRRTHCRGAASPTSTSARSARLAADENYRSPSKRERARKLVSQKFSSGSGSRLLDAANETAVTDLTQAGAGLRGSKKKEKARLTLVASVTKTREETSWRNTGTPPLLLSLTQKHCDPTFTRGVHDSDETCARSSSHGTRYTGVENARRNTQKHTKTGASQSTTTTKRAQPPLCELHFN